jgi:hypothetical protein
MQATQQVNLPPILTPEHAKELLPLIIPKVVPKDGSKIVLLAIFFGANDATLEGTVQHVPSLSASH